VSLRVGSLVAALLLLSFASAGGRSTAAPGAPPPASKLRSDLAALVSGGARLDDRIAPLVAGYRPGELPYFALLSEPNDAAHEAQLTALGARVLRRYRSVSLFALASDAGTVLRVAALPWVERLAPIELVFALDDEQEADQTRAKTADVGAPPQWNLGNTGAGVRIAVLDTGIDPSHPDLDDQDFRHWSSVLNPPKVVEARDFNGGACKPLLGNTDFHGHGTHVAAIAAGTGEGAPGRADDGRITGIAPGAELAVGKALTDAGAGLNSDLIAAMEWAAMPADASPTGCSVGAHVVNMSVGSEARPNRLNSDSDVDMVSYVLNQLAVRYGTLFVGAAGNSGPFVGSVLEAPGSAAQALGVGAAAKDYDVTNDDTLSGEPCAGWAHDPSNGTGAATACGDRFAGQTPPPSLSVISSRGPSGDLLLRPDVVAPGYNIVSAQAVLGTALAGQDINPKTRLDPLYATATGTSMATPAAAGSAALLLAGYRERYDSAPSGASGSSTLARAPAYALVRAALMNTAGADMREARVIGLGDLFPVIVYEARNIRDDPYVGPFGEGAGKINVGRALAALRDGAVIYSAASDGGTGRGDLQGSWQAGAVPAGSSRSQRFVLHAAPGAGLLTAAFAFEPGRPSDGSLALPASWVSLPASATVAGGGDALVDFGLAVPADALPGHYTGRVAVGLSDGSTLRVPVLVSVPLHDTDTAPDAVSGQGRYDSSADVYAKADTQWPSVAGAALGAGSDWSTFALDLAAGLSEVRLSVHDTAGAADDVYDVYLYDPDLDLVASTHPFLPGGQGISDPNAIGSRAPSTPDSPARLVVRTPAGGRHLLVVNRAEPGQVPSYGAFALAVDEVSVAAEALPTTLTYEDDFVVVQGRPAKFRARLLGSDGAPVAGRPVSFRVDGVAEPCPGGCTAPTDYRGDAVVPVDPALLAPGVHEVRADFGGDAFWQPSSATALVVVVSSTLPDPGGGKGGHVTAGGWLGAREGADRVHFAFNAKGSVAPAGDFHWRDLPNGIDVALVAYSAVVVDGDTASLSGSARHADGRTESFALMARDVGEPGKGRDTVRLRLAAGYDRAATLGGGNVQLHKQ
jgi:subtilisin family serine protease